MNTYHRYIFISVTAMVYNASGYKLIAWYMYVLFFFWILF